MRQSFLNTGVILAALIERGNLFCSTDLFSSWERIWFKMSGLSLIIFTGIFEFYETSKLFKFMVSFFNIRFTGMIKTKITWVLKPIFNWPENKVFIFCYSFQQRVANVTGVNFRGFFSDMLRSITTTEKKYSKFQKFFGCLIAILHFLLEQYFPNILPYF